MPRGRRAGSGKSKEKSQLRGEMPENGDAKVSRAEAVYAGLRRAIIEQALAPSTKLPEDVIGDRFGVSRTVVRAALTRLAAEGLVELRLNRGATVAKPSLSEGNDVFNIRQSLERLVVARLAGNLSRADIAKLKAHVAAEEQAKGRDGPESIRLAGEFHILLAELTGNSILSRYVGELVSRSSLILALYGRPHSSDCAVAEHMEIIEALTRGDAASAGRVMDHHLDGVMGRALIAPRAERNIRDILSAYAAE
jgi:DNA-binding GntR family transcriptional regulator